MHPIQTNAAVWTQVAVHDVVQHVGSNWQTISVHWSQPASSGPPVTQALWLQPLGHAPQSDGQVLQVSPPAHTPFPQAEHSPQSAGQLEQVSPLSQSALPHGL